VTAAQTLLLPNLGAEEGNDWRAYSSQPATRVAAHLWSLLYSANAQLYVPSTNDPKGPESFRAPSAEDGWPVALGIRPSQAAYPWIETPGAVIPWLMSPTLADTIGFDLGLRVEMPDSQIVAIVHDKAFSLESARDLDLIPACLASLSEVLSPSDLADYDETIRRLTTRLSQWPDWTGQRFTLKPRFGSSGRGRVAGARTVDTEAIRGALPRLAQRGGAIFEPWLDRRTDLSVCFHLPRPGASDATGPLPTLLGSLEMLATPSGLYRGHCGEFDHRGRIFSGHREDETLRAQAASLAGVAKQTGYFGPCGVDAFTFVKNSGNDAREHLRPAVEFNARVTMGLVALGILRRAIPSRGDALGIEPGDRRAFLLGMLGENADQIAREISQQADSLMAPLDLSSSKSESSAPKPFLFFSRDLESLRKAYRDQVGC